MKVKSVGTFPVILVKLATPPLPFPPTPNKVEFRARWVEISAFLATTLLGGVGGRRDEAKVDQKIVTRSRGYLTGFFTQSQVLLSPIHTIPIFYDTDTFFMKRETDPIDPKLHKFLPL